MKRRLPTPLILLALSLLLALVTGVAIAVQQEQPQAAETGGAVYSVGQVEHWLDQNPAAWRGRVVFVQGTPTTSHWETSPMNEQVNLYVCSPPQPCALAVPTGRFAEIYLVDNGLYRPHIATPHPLLLRVPPVSSNALLPFLRRLPPIGSLLPPPPPPRRWIRGGVPHIYRIQLLGTNHGICLPQSMLCDEAVLLDAQP